MAYGRRVLGYIYFVRCPLNSLIKIGYTDDHPDFRLRSLRAGSPVELEPIAAMRGELEHEGQLHLLFHEHRDHSEWFRPSPEILAYILEYAQPWPSPPDDRRFPLPESNNRIWNAKIRHLRRWAIAMLTDEERASTVRVRDLTERWSWIARRDIETTGELDRIEERSIGFELNRMRDCLLAFGVEESELRRFTARDATDMRDRARRDREWSMTLYCENRELRAKLKALETPQVVPPAPEAETPVAMIAEPVVEADETPVKPRRERRSSAVPKPERRHSFDLQALRDRRP